MIVSGTASAFCRGFHQISASQDRFFEGFRCTEVGGRVVTNMFVRDMDLGVLVVGDKSREEVAAVAWRSAVGSGRPQAVFRGASTGQNKHI